MNESKNITDVIAGQNEKFMTYFNSGDYKGLSSLYTGDCLILAPNAEVIKGVEGTAEFWHAVMNMGVKSAKLETIGLDIADTMVCEMGKYYMYTADGQEIDHGKYIVLWKHEQNTWKLDKDIWNSSKPLS